MQSLCHSRRRRPLNGFFACPDSVRPLLVRPCASYLPVTPLFGLLRSTRAYRSARRIGSLDMAGRAAHLAFPLTPERSASARSAAVSPSRRRNDRISGSLHGGGQECPPHKSTSSDAAMYSRCLRWVSCCLPEDAGVTAGVPRIAVDLLHRLSRRSWAYHTPSVRARD